ncbi:MAG: DUF3631 domain-containing protein [Candidatus Thiodiazotropha lotti]|nr:DUF3631 domain-containing protein [Candidatus Thiodiazotropha lotti]MCW4182250.1 DUF3631 domain-containing protein [Candidatus Thiodiazotropha weberae]
MSDYPPSHDQDVFNELSSLSAVEYDRRRESEAKKLGIRVGTLDSEVNKLRNDPYTQHELKGREIQLYEPEPWPVAVNGEEVLNEAANHITRHMMIRKADANACALWAAHTYMFNDFEHSPRLMITANTAESGKTLLMNHLIGNLVNKPLSVELMKPAPFFRVIEDYKPTFLIDECDVFMKADIDLMAAINAGWEPKGCVARCAGDDSEVRAFSTFTPTVLCGIKLLNLLKSTTIGRSIVVKLQRAAYGEINQNNIYNRRSHQEGIRLTGRKLARWIQDNRMIIGQQKPAMPDGIINRIADKWTPLLSIADIAGGKWPEISRYALLSQSDAKKPCLSTQLLRDIEKVTKFSSHVFTEDLIHKICQLTDSPWPQYNKEKGAIKSTQIAKLLADFSLSPTTVRIGDKSKKGYKKEQLRTAHDRYAANHAQHANLDVTPSHPNNLGQR